LTLMAGCGRAAGVAGRGADIGQRGIDLVDQLRQIVDGYRVLDTCAATISVVNVSKSRDCSVLSMLCSWE